MLFSADAWPRIADGSITVTFRAGTRAQAKVGGRYRVAGMLIEATGVRQVGIDEITADDARRTGAIDRDARLARLDRNGAWTRTTLQLIERYPGVVSTTLARHVQQDRATFKLNVRKLKELGLTESLDIGYRLSPRGEAVLHGQHVVSVP